MKTILSMVLLLIAVNTNNTVYAQVAPATNSTTANAENSDQNPLSTLLTPYFAIKNALVNEDQDKAKEHAAVLILAIPQLPTEGLTEALQKDWNKRQKKINDLAQKLSNSKNIAQQRTAFASLSQALYPLVQKAGSATPIYYQKCPMYAQGRGGHWLSLDKDIRNPLYGKKMMTCGSTVETISNK